MFRPATSSAIASLPDHGALIQYARTQTIARSAYRWRAVEVSEAHALNAIATGHLSMPRPDGKGNIDLQYVRHIEHDNGNWTWIGRPAGAQPGTEAIITFGEKAVFGTIPYGDGPPLRLTMEGGRTLLMETDGAREAQLASRDNGRNDALTYKRQPKTPGANPQAGAASRITGFPEGMDVAAESIGASAMGAQGVTAQAATANSSRTVDVLMGYTSGFRARLGGSSQAITRLTNMLDIANTALVNSQVNAQYRLVKGVEVNYPDATDNAQALYDLTGWECGAGCNTRPIPAALQALHTARNTYGADLVTLVRTFQEPENGGCGVAWLIGSGRFPIVQSDEDAGMSVVSDSSGTVYSDNSRYCADESLAHEFGHNLGVAHDRTTAAGTDGVLQNDEYGTEDWSFGYRTNATPTHFRDIMAYGEDGANQQAVRLYSNPRVTCFGAPCGVENNADAARTLQSTVLTVAQFRGMVARFGDVNGEYWAFDYIRRFANAGITSGCVAETATSLPLYCPEATVTREQMSIFVVRAQHGIAFTPPAATGMFGDVPTSSPYAPWIEQMVRDGITSGCTTSPAMFCPTSAVNRDQMAVLIVRARHGGAFTPPSPTGMFQDVPTNYWAAAYIEQLAADGVTSGCSSSPMLFCPTDAVTRAQMAVFLARAYGF